MREPADPERVRKFMQAFGRACTGPGRVYLTGGATALLHGWRQSTMDIDLKLEPEPGGAFEAIRDLKNRLSINIELASPDQFIPPIPGWEGRSEFIDRFASVDFFHYDMQGQALSKIARGYERDRRDVAAMLQRGLVSDTDLRSAFQKIRTELIRYPRLDEATFAARIEEWL